MDVSVADWRGDLIAHGLRDSPLDGAISVRAIKLACLRAGPMDRLITAPAEFHECLLTTGDEWLLGWNPSLPRIDARR